MKDFFKIVLGNLVAQSIIACSMLLLGLAFLFLLAFSSSTPRPTLQDGSVLVLDLRANISDSPPTETLNDAIDQAIGGGHVPNYYLLELIDGLEQAAQDDRIDALYLHGELLPVGYGSGLAVIAEVRDAITRFKESGKPVYAYMVDPSIKDYYLMSVADEIYMNPFGLIQLNGLSIESVYFGDAFEKYGIGMQATKAGKYKSAVETFTSNSMSEADREQLTALIEDLWSGIVNDVVATRGASRSQLLQESNEQGFFLGPRAKELKLVDHVAYLDEVITMLKDTHGEDEEYEIFRQIDMSDYIAEAGFRQHGPPTQWDETPRIAVVYAEGEIVDGEGLRSQIGGDHLSRWIRHLREDENVAAIVLRVNSPGGSAVASELIQREVREARQIKPVVVSMGSMAASGGYWISAYADQIFAEQSTITGSIGVFGLAPNIKGLANEHGVNFDGVKTSQYADLYTISRPKTEEEMALIQQFVDHLYDEFLKKVSEGRGLPLEEVKKIAQGRVWSGQDAMNIGLVDQMGGLTMAINYAVDMAGLRGGEWMVSQTPEPSTLAESLVRMMEAPGSPPVIQAPKEDFVDTAISRLKHELSVLRAYNDPRNAYARLPYSLEIR